MPKTFIAMIVDETGSMSSRRQTAIDSTNEFLAAHSEIKECYGSLITFDHRSTYTWLHESKTNEAPQPNVRFLAGGAAITDVPKLTTENYNPRGMTNLYDAIGMTIQHMEGLTKFAEDPTVIIMINTDGEENASKEFTGESIKALIEEKKKLNWEFIFIAEELGEAQTRGMANTLGIDANMTINVTGTTRSAMFKSMADATTLYSADAGVLGAKGCTGPQGERGVTLASYMNNIDKSL